MYRATLLLLVACFFVSAARGDPCYPNPCQNGGTCRPPDAGYNWGYRCDCKGLYTGTQCEWDSKQCNVNTTTPCVNGGVCVERQDGRFCDCPGSTANYIAYGGHYCEKVNPCASCPSGTASCQWAPNMPKGRLCLDQSGKEIEGSR